MTRWLVPGLLCAACASTTFDGRVYRSGDVAFRLAEIPEQWRRLDSADALLGFRDDQAASTIAVNGRCGKDAEDVPLQALTQHLFLQFTERETQSQELIQLDGREALQTSSHAKLDGVRKDFLVVVLKKNGCVYDFMYVSAAPPSNDAQERFERFVQGFSTLD